MDLSISKLPIESRVVLARFGRARKATLPSGASLALPQMMRFSIGGGTGILPLQSHN
jgi:hypothetical protein